MLRSCPAPRERPGFRVGNTVSLVAAVLMLVTAPATVPAGALDDWVGRLVVPKNREFVLRLDDEPVEPSRKAIVIYRVERADDPTLWLRAEGLRLSGSAKVEDVVPVDRAIAYFTEALGRQPNDAFAYAMRAVVRADRHELDAALHDFDQAVRLESDNPMLYLRRGELRLVRGDRDQAIDDFSRAIRLEPRSALAYRGRGMAWAMKKDHDRAIEDHSEAIWLDPLCISAYLARGVAWQEKQEYQKAIVDYNKVIRLDPESAEGYQRRAIAWLALKAYDRAISDFELAITVDDKAPIAYDRLAWIRATSPVARYRDGKKAVEAATRACDLTSRKNPAFLSTLAAAHAEAGDFDSAAKWQILANRLESKAKDRVQGESRLADYRSKTPYRDR